MECTAPSIILLEVVANGFWMHVWSSQGLSSLLVVVSCRLRYTAVGYILSAAARLNGSKRVDF